MQIIDANIVLRYVLDDHEELSKKARDIIDNNFVEIPIEVLCEVIYVLTSVYNVGRNDINTELHKFFERTLCALPHREAVLKGLVAFAESNLDFVDCLLAGYQSIEGAEIYTFDKKLQNYLKRLQ
jgi:predicted nucleic-acid-binding protein